MNYRYPQKSVAISLRDHKIAALFFDSIIPLHSWNDVPQEVREDNIFEQFTESIDLTDSDAATFFRSTIADKDDFDQIVDNLEAEKRLVRFLIAEAIRLSSSSEISFVPVVKDFHNSTSNADALMVSLLNLNLIDTTNACWEQILNFRSDQKSVSKLRNLRLFLYDNFKGKNSAYIKDSIRKKIEDYENSCKKHGFDLIASSVSMLLDAKSMIGLLGITATGMLVGTSPTLAALSGAMIEIGKISIKILSRHYDFKSNINNHELGYIFEVKDRFK